MTSDDVWRRSPPARSEPIRDWTEIPRQSAWTSFFGTPEGRAEAGEEPSGERPPTLGSVVSEGVALGYRVIEEQIEQGRRAAERMGQQAYGPAAMTDDYTETAQRMLRFYAEAGQLWLQLATLLMSGMAMPGLLWGLNGFAPPGAGARHDERGPGAPPAAAAGRGARPAASMPPPSSQGDADAPSHPDEQPHGAIAIEVASSRPVRAELDLQPGAERLHLAIAELRSLDRESKPLTGVVFEPGAPGEPPTLRVHVPDQQAPDVYHGVVVDRRTGRPAGTLSIQVRP